MSKADKLLREWMTAREKYLATKVDTEDEYAAQGELMAVEKSVRAYLNEKPHEPHYEPPVALYTKEEGRRLASPPHAAAEPEKPVNEDLLENAYWEFDARKNGYSVWKGLPQSERDAFKSAVRNLLVASLVASPSAQPIARDEQDAKRYRWLMDVWDEACPFANGLPLWDYDSSMVNAAIDHERLAEKDKGG